jgi:formylglycine-generating enzyme
MGIVKGARRLAVVVISLLALRVAGQTLDITSFDQKGELTFARASNAINYRVEWASSPNGVWTSSWSSLVNIEPTGAYHTVKVPMYYRVVAASTLANMALIPAGSFQMGDSLAEGDGMERPVHSAFVSTFYIEKREVTKQLWDSVYVWATNHGYAFDNSGSTYLGVNYSKGTNHPVHMVTWYDVVKWCNARSQKENLTPCYYTSAAQTTPYRTGLADVEGTWVKWNVNGYRLPTEAEWERAARGGLSGQRFPWGTNITHSFANYRSTPADAYDVSPTRDFHPSYAVGNPPYTGPVGSFQPNAFGLYDMAGNVFEWCWDLREVYPSTPQTDPRGPAFVSGEQYRIVRGGSWNDPAVYNRCAIRGYDTAESFWNYTGFRCVRSNP